MPISWSRFSLCSLFKYYNMVNLVRWKSQCGWPFVFPQLSRAKDALSINLSFWFSNTCILARLFAPVQPCPSVRQSIWHSVRLIVFIWHFLKSKQYPHVQFWVAWLGFVFIVICQKQFKRKICHLTI